MYAGNPFEVLLAVEHFHLLGNQVQGPTDLPSNRANLSLGPANVTTYLFSGMRLKPLLPRA